MPGEHDQIEAYRVNTREFGGNRIGYPSFVKDLGGGYLDLMDNGGLFRNTEPVLHANLCLGHHSRAENHLRRRRCRTIFRSRRR